MKTHWKGTLPECQLLDCETPKGARSFIGHWAIQESEKIANCYHCGDRILKNTKHLAWHGHRQNKRKFDRRTTLRHCHTCAQIKYDQWTLITIETLQSIGYHNPQIHQYQTHSELRARYQDYVASNQYKIIPRAGPRNIICHGCHKNIPKMELHIHEPRQQQLRNGELRELQRHWHPKCYDQQWQETWQQIWQQINYNINHMGYQNHHHSTNNLKWNTTKTQYTYQTTEQKLQENKNTNKHFALLKQYHDMGIPITKITINTKTQQSHFEPTRINFEKLLEAYPDWCPENNPVKHNLKICQHVKHLNFEAYPDEKLGMIITDRGGRYTFNKSQKIHWQPIIQKIRKPLRDYLKTVAK